MKKDMDNKQLIQSYFQQNEFSDVTETLYRGAIKLWDMWVDKPLSQATKDDLILWNKKSQEEYEDLRHGKRPKKLSLASRDKYASNLKRLYTFNLIEGGMDEDDASNQANKIWRAIPLTAIRRKADKENLLKDKVITPDEFQALLEGARHPRFKCAIALAFDTGCRSGELFSIKIKDIALNETYGTIKVTGKTGERTVPIHSSIPYLKLWLNLHPDPKPDSALFMTTRRGLNKPVHPRSFAKSVGDLAKKLKIRNIHPHLFRHSRATDLANKRVNEETLRKIFGWSSGSTMPAKYIHMAQSQAIAVVFKADGIEVPDKDFYTGLGLWKTKACPFCGGEIGADLHMCPHCMELLDPAARPVVDSEALSSRIVELEEHKDVLSGVLKGELEKRDKEIAELKEMVQDLFTIQQLKAEGKWKDTLEAEQPK